MGTQINNFNGTVFENWQDDYQEKQGVYDNVSQVMSNVYSIGESLAKGNSDDITNIFKGLGWATSAHDFVNANNKVEAAFKITGALTAGYYGNKVSSKFGKKVQVVVDIIAINIGSYIGEKTYKLGKDIDDLIINSIGENNNMSNTYIDEGD